VYFSDGLSPYSGWTVISELFCHRRLEGGFLDDGWRSTTVFAWSSGISPSPIQASTGLAGRLAPAKSQYES
jgi:hypothetical protein